MKGTHVRTLEGEELDLRSAIVLVGIHLEIVFVFRLDTSLQYVVNGRMRGGDGISGWFSDGSH